ncbi:MAG: hypothetical protein ACK47B_02235 [Armatimonadota bacterium]
MKYFRCSIRRTWFARVLAGLMVAPYFGVAATPVQAQQTTPLIYVLDFNNSTTVGGALLGKTAAAQVSLQLAESPNWEVVPESLVQRQIQDLGLEPPFDRPDRVAIARGVDATAVLYGTVTEARVVDGTTPYAEATVRVIVEDIATGVPISGAIGRGRSTARMGFSGNADILLEEAIGKAAYQAREFMDRFRLPSGTVLNTTVRNVEEGDLEVLMNIGARQGVRPGMEMIVTRLRQPVARVRVTQVDADLSRGRIIQNIQGVQPEDRVRAIFNFADFPMTRAQLRSSAEAPLPAAARPGAAEADGPARVAKVQRDAGFVNLRAPADADLVLSQNAPQTPPPVVVDVDEPAVERSSSRGRGILGNNAVKLAAGGLLLLGLLALGGRGGENATRPHDSTAFNFQPDLGVPGARIRTCWERPKSLSSSHVLGYVIWRLSSTGAFEVVGGVDADSTRCFIDTEATRDVVAYDGQPGSDAGSRTTFPAVPGIVPGVSYRYQVATAFVYQNNWEDDDSDLPTDPVVGDEIMSPLSESTPWVTAIVPPNVIAIDGEPVVANQEVDPRAVDVTWQQTPGADTYVIWASRNPNFGRGSRRTFGPFRVVPSDQGGPMSVSRTINISGLANRAREPIFITVGARNSGDRTQPKPFGAMFGPAVQVRPESGPPGPPSARPQNQKKNDRGGKDRDGKLRLERGGIRPK